MENIFTEILFYIYDFFLFTAMVLYLPFYFGKKKIDFLAFKQRLGSIPVKSAEPSIWIQAVSVGEVHLAAGLIKELRNKYKDPIILSITTLAGYNLAKDKYPALAEFFFFPADFSGVVDQVMNRVNPKLFISIETEIWPNLFYRLNKGHIPIVILNARISEKAYLRYKFARFLIKPALKRVAVIGAQDEEYKKRFIVLGAEPLKVAVTGNMKFSSFSVDPIHLQKVKDDYGAVLARSKVQVIVAGSTHNGEEEMIVEVYLKCLNKIKDLILILAPRQVSRADDIEKIVKASGLKVWRFSKISKCPQETHGVVILDAVGELFYFYSLADICFVGGSLIPHGGHNILEPIYFNKPVIFGRYMDNFKEISDIVNAKKAGILVNNQQELENNMLELLLDKNKRINIASLSREVFDSGKDSMPKSLRLIESCYKE